MFAPRAIAIVGASGRQGNPFARPLQYLLQFGYEGAVYPVNPMYESLHGVPCYPDLASLPGPVDLVLFLVSARETVRQLPAVAAAGARAAVVFASGFAEAGPEGRRLQEELVRLARAHDIRVLGPNCQGVMSVPHRMAATFTAAVEDGHPRAGNVAYIGQSGAVGGSILSLARERGLGIAAWASTGNQADLTALDVGEYLIEDDQIRILMLYLESAVDGRAYERIATRAAQLRKSLVVLQSGISTGGARAAASHTGAIVGTNAAFLEMSRELGVIVAEDIEDFIATAQALSVLPRADGRRVGIVTTSGGAGCLAADSVEDAGLTVDPLDAATQADLSTVMPDFGAVGNPVDVTAQLFRTGEPEPFVDVCRKVIADPTVDSVLVALTLVTGPMATKLAEHLSALWIEAPKPMVVVWLAAREQTAQARMVLRDRGLPLLESPRTAAAVLRALSTPWPKKRARAMTARPSRELLGALEHLRGPVVLEADGGQLLDLAGIRRPRQYLVTSAAAAREAAEAIGGPVVMKIQSPQVLHKTDRGGVRVGVRPTDAAAVFDELDAAFADVPGAGVLVQEMVGPGPELVVGMTRSGTGFPPLLTVGMGGVAVELFRDTASRLAPVDEEQAEQMMRQLRSAPLLTGFRGRPGVALQAAARAIAGISRLGVELGERLVELEINPLRLCDDGAAAVALDFLLRLHEPTSSSVGAATLPTA